MPLAPGNVLSLGFSGSGKWVITYSAECAVAAAAGNQGAFCTSNGTAGADGWFNASIIVVTPPLALGAHTVEVRASIINGVAGDSGWLDDSTILISK